MSTKPKQPVSQPKPPIEDERQEKASTKLDHQGGHAAVLFDDIRYLMSRVQLGSLATISEYFEIQEEIHELQYILADWDAYVAKAIAKKAAQLAIDGMVTQINLQLGRREI
jgi:hypothetical protein